MSRRAAGVVGAVFALALAWAAVASPYPLIRVACTLGLASLFSGVIITCVLSTRIRARLTGVVGVLMLVAFVGMWVCTHQLGGGALNGEIRGGSYFLAHRPQHTEVSRGKYWLVAAVELTVFALWPLGFVLLITTSQRENPGSASQSAGGNGGRRTSG
jgi:hypothetical protein